MKLEIPKKLLTLPEDEKIYPVYNIMHDRCYHDHVAYLELYDIYIFRVSVINQVTKEYLCDFFESEFPRFGTSESDQDKFRKLSADLSDRLLNSYKKDTKNNDS